LLCKEPITPGHDDDDLCDAAVAAENDTETHDSPFQRLRVQDGVGRLQSRFHSLIIPALYEST
jgi:hypothetical protein